MSHHIVEARDVSFTYPDGTDALSNISFRIEHGCSVALIGANGAGKSTLTLLLNGCLCPSSGEIEIGGIKVSKETACSIRKAVGMVFQNPDDQLFMPTVEEDISFGPANLGLTPSEITENVSLAMEKTGITHLRNKPPYRLSAGEKRAAAIAGVITMSPDILVMDEPSSNLDPMARRRIIELLKSFPHTKIIATHDMELVLEVCSRVILLDRGKIAADGTANEILANETMMKTHGLETPHILRHHHPHC